MSTLGPNSGAMRGAALGAINNIVGGCPGTVICITGTDTWTLDAQDMLRFTSTGTWTPIIDAAGNLEGSVVDERTLTITGGSGKYAGATGTLSVKGTGYNLFGPNFGEGSTYFDVRFEGLICTPN